MNGKIKVGLMGFGTVGTGVVRLVDSYKEDFFNQTGSVIEVSRILVRNPEKERSIFVNSDIVTTDPWNLFMIRKWKS